MDSTRKLYGLASLALGLAWAGCSQDASAPGAGPTTSSGDASLIEVSAPNIDNGPATSDQGVIPDPEKDSGPTIDVPPAAGAFMAPCEGNGDCDSGFCITHLGNQVCSKACVDECPDGWSCQQVFGTDLLYACVSHYTHLCRPCAESADCASAFGVEDVCVSYGANGSFCGADCSETGGCPPGYSCTAVETTEGVAIQQCRADSGVCACSAEAVKLGLSTPCEKSGDHGTCTGARTCTEAGLTACDAGDPQAEVCNGVDDDCDGETDEATCDDDNACTDDACDGAGGCQYTAKAGASCDDGNNCTLADHCEDGVCSGTTINCDDGNICTTDTCEPTGGCAYSFNNAACTDGDPCTVNDACALGDCTGVGVSCECKTDLDCVLLEDGDVCNGTLFCDVAAFPHKCTVDPKTVIACPEPEGPGAQCLKAACHPLSGDCQTAPDNQGGLCDDGDACSASAACQDGQCEGSGTINCNDGIPCTDDSCEPGKGCVHTNNKAACDDGNSCTVADFCLGGECQSGPPQACDDGNPCTSADCDSSAGCTFAPSDGDCDDKNPCTTGDHCAAGACAAGGSLKCDDGNVCTLDSCDIAAGCQHGNNTAPCDDDNPCTAGDTCAGGACKGLKAVSCDDGDTCTTDLCDPTSGCEHVANSQPCSDGNVCTVGDACKAGECEGGPEIACNDGNPCTDDSCNAVAGCTTSPNDGDCNDGNVCTTGDGCSQGACSGSGLLDCSDDNICTQDSCDPAKGCVNAPLDAGCDDGDPCTAGDKCAQGGCVGTQAASCDDGNPCTADDCESGVGCTHANNTDPCDDTNTCTTGDTCTGGVCVGVGVFDCDDGNQCTKDVCVPGGDCQHVAAAGACSDGDACTVGDSCAAGVCTAGAAKSCDDNNVCTTDGCSAGECTHAPASGECTDANGCTFGDHCVDGACIHTGLLDCDDEKVCTTDSCDPKTGCKHADNTAACSDGDLCTPNDTCVGGACVGSGQLPCDDGNVCTTNACDPKTGCTTANTTAECDDKNACTPADVCIAGACTGTGTVVCEDNKVCTTDSCDPALGCVNANNTAVCSDNDACTTGDVCTDGACTPTGTLTCSDNSVCTTDSCDNGCVFTNLADGTSCGAELHCQSGACVPVCNLASGSQNLGQTNSVQTFVVPDCVTSLTIEAFGAQGGKNNPCSQQGGRGARMKGTFVVTPGESLSVIVGERGKDRGSNQANESGTGGGGSFIFRPGNQALLLAAGGGGGGAICTSGGSPSFATGKDGVTGECGTACTTNQQQGGCNGNDGSGPAKGKGWNSVKSNPAGVSGEGTSGGFGGGGTVASSHGGGGGGGFSGGGGEKYTGNPAPAGGGGGSFNGGTAQSNSSGVKTGHGSVVFTW